MKELSPQAARRSRVTSARRTRSVISAGRARAATCTPPSTPWSGCRPRLLQRIGDVVRWSGVLPWTLEGEDMAGWLSLEEEMREAAKDLRFGYAARLRDEIAELKRELREVAEAG